MGDDRSKGFRKSIKLSFNLFVRIVLNLVVSQGWVSLMLYIDAYSDGMVHDYAVLFIGFVIVVFLLHISLKRCPYTASAVQRFRTNGALSLSVCL